VPKAAEQGYSKAQFELGNMYETGEGVAQDYIKAFMWFDLAASSAEDQNSFYEAVFSRNRIAKEMTPEQIAEAEKLARAWESARK